LSAGADGRLDKVTVPPDAPVMRAIHSGVPVAAQGADDIFGAAIPDRRRAERAGIAYPLRDGHFVIGALVVTGPPIPPATPAADLLQRLVADLGSRLAAARAVHEAEQRAVRDTDLVARIGGEEFAIWMPHTPSEVGLEVAGRIRATVESTVWRWSGQAYPLTLSCGVASYPDTVRDLANLRGAADAALYA